MATSIASRLAPGMRLRQRYLIQEVRQRTLQTSTYLALDEERYSRPCLLTEFPVKSSHPKVQEQVLAQFRSSAVPLFQLHHPQLPHFSGAFRHGQSLFLVQNRTEGVSYLELLQARQDQGKALTEPEVLHLLVQLLPALGKMHQRQILHGRIAPDSILCPLIASAEEGARSAILPEAPMLSNFGAVDRLARNLTAVQVGKKPKSAAVGLSGYAPPEQIQTGRTYPHSDLYMLAVTCLVLMTGRQPQELLDSQTLAWNWQPYITLSRDFEEILEIMLAWQPGDRYPSTQAVLADARPALQQLNSHRFPLLDRSPRLPFPMSIQPITAEEVLAPRPASFPEENPFQSDLPESFEILHPKTSHWAIAVGVGLSLGVMGATATFISPASVSPLGALSSERTGLLRPITLPDRFQGLTVEWPTWMSQLGEKLPQIRQRRPSSPNREPMSQLDFDAPMISSQKGEGSNLDNFEEEIGEEEAGKVAIADAADIEDIPVPIYFEQADELRSLSGTLYELRSQTYLLVADAGQELAVRLDAVDAELSILDSRRQPVEFEAELTQQWRGELPWSDRYYITVMGKGEFRLNIQLKDPIASKE